VLILDEFDNFLAYNGRSNDALQIFELSEHLLLIGISNSMDINNLLCTKYSVENGGNFDLGEI
jgi:Cdc6-like AAA superfamily ATPase